jgi:hypothetical protein
LDDACNHEDGQGAVCFIAVQVDVDEGPAFRVNITIPMGLLRSLDDYAKRRGVSRSAFLAMAARNSMQRGA